MMIHFEFTSVAREITGQRVIQMDITGGSSYRDIIHLVAQKYPGLLGIFIDEKSLELSSGCLLTRNGIETIMPDDMQKCPEDGDHLMLIIFIVGG